MRLNHLRNVLLSIGALLFAVGCAPLAPLQNVQSQPISASKPSVTLDEVGNAIVRAGASLNMQMQKVRPGVINATYIPIGGSGASAVMEIKYDTKQYSIAYKDSQGLKYDGNQIHKNYNNWVRNLDNRIRVQLSTL